MNKIAKSALGLIIITILSKILGFGRELVLTYIYGATDISDIYITTLSIPGTLFATIGVAISTICIPLFYEIDGIDGRKKSLDFINNIFNITLIISIILIIISLIFIEPLVKVFAINFNGEKLQIAIKFTKIMIFGVLFLGINSIISAWLQINENFIIPGMIGFPYNIFIICGIIISSKGSVELMAIGALMATASQFFFQLPYAIKNGYKYKLYVNIKDEYIKKILYLIGPVFIGVAVNQLNMIIDRSLSSTLGEGFITILNSANRLNGFVQGLFISTIVSIIYPRLSKLSSKNNKQKFIDSICKSVNIIIIFIIPISVGAIVLSEPVVKIVFERGAFDSNDTTMTAIALSCYSIGMLGFGLREILNKVFYSLQDTKTPMINGALAMGMNIIFNIILVNFLGHAGLALATSISSLICILLLFNSLKKKIGYFGQDKIIKTMLKSLISAIVMGVVTYFIYNRLVNILGVGFIEEALALFGSVGIGAIVYCIVAIILKVEEVNIITNMVKRKISA